MGDRKPSAPDVGAVSFWRVLYFCERHSALIHGSNAPRLAFRLSIEAAFVYAKASPLSAFVFLKTISVNNWMRNRCVMSYLHAKMRHANVFAYKRQWTLEKQE
jgi:hypothetical protein